MEIVKPSMLAVTVLGVLLLAGCLGGADPVPRTWSTGDSSEDRGVAVGTVVDPERRPLAGAMVTHVATGLAARTNASGVFRLEALPAVVVLVEASANGFYPKTIALDLRHVPEGSLTFVLSPRPNQQVSYMTNSRVGQVTCQVAAGSHHGFPGHHQAGCRDVAPDGLDEARVPINAGALSVLVELAWTPQSPAADVLGLTVFLTTPREDLLMGEVHAEMGEHYARLYSGTTPFDVVKGPGHVVHSIVNVGPGLMDDHVPNAGAAVQQKFQLYTTAFFGQPPSPSWSAVKLA